MAPSGRARGSIPALDSKLGGSMAPPGTGGSRGPEAASVEAVVVASCAAVKTGIFNVLGCACASSSGSYASQLRGKSYISHFNN